METQFNLLNEAFGEFCFKLKSIQTMVVGQWEAIQLQNKKLQESLCVPSVRNEAPRPLNMKEESVRGSFKEQTRDQVFECEEGYPDVHMEFCELCYRVVSSGDWICADTEQQHWSSSPIPSSVIGRLRLDSSLRIKQVLQRQLALQAERVARAAEGTTRTMSPHAHQSTATTPAQSEQWRGRGRSASLQEAGGTGDLLHSQSQTRRRADSSSSYSATSSEEVDTVKVPPFYIPPDSEDEEEEYDEEEEEDDSWDTCDESEKVYTHPQHLPSRTGSSSSQASAQQAQKPKKWRVRGRTNISTNPSSSRTTTATTTALIQSATAAPPAGDHSLSLNEGISIGSIQTDGNTPQQLTLTALNGAHKMDKDLFQQFLHEHGGESKGGHFVVTGFDSSGTATFLDESRARTYKIKLKGLNNRIKSSKDKKATSGISSKIKGSGVSEDTAQDTKEVHNNLTSLSTTSCSATSSSSSGSSTNSSNSSSSEGLPCPSTVFPNSITTPATSSCYSTGAPIATASSSNSNDSFQEGDEEVQETAVILYDDDGTESSQPQEAQQASNSTTTTSTTTTTNPSTTTTTTTEHNTACPASPSPVSNADATTDTCGEGEGVAGDAATGVTATVTAAAGGEGGSSNGGGGGGGSSSGAGGSSGGGGVGGPTASSITGNVEDDDERLPISDDPISEWPKFTKLRVGKQWKTIKTECSGFCIGAATGGASSSSSSTASNTTTDGTNGDQYMFINTQTLHVKNIMPAVKIGDPKGDPTAQLNAISVQQTSRDYVSTLPRGISKWRTSVSNWKNTGGMIIVGVACFMSGHNVLLPVGIDLSKGEFTCPGIPGCPCTGWQHNSECHEVDFQFNKCKNQLTITTAKFSSTVPFYPSGRLHPIVKCAADVQLDATITALPQTP